MTVGYRLRPNALRDLRRQALYLATEATPDVGHRFLAAASATFSILATQPKMGWVLQAGRPRATPLRAFRIPGFEDILVLYRPLRHGVEIARVVHGLRDLPKLLR